MTAQHTPGPWEATSDGEIFAADDGRSVAFAALARMTIEDVEGNAGAASANARLIALSPEMLSFVGMIARMTPDGEMRDGAEIYQMDPDDAIETLGNLIAKARDLEAKTTGAA